MKQEITRAQLGELSDKAIARFDQWMLHRGYVNEDMTIGQMIELLEQESSGRFTGMFKVHSDEWDVDVSEPLNRVAGELCDALWEAVKEVLEHER